MVVVLTITFGLYSVLPSDPARNALGLHASEEAVAELRHELGIDRPIIARYVHYILGVLKLDFGKSTITRQSVTPLLARAFRLTLVNWFMAMCVVLIIGMIVTCLAYVVEGRLQSLFLSTCRALTSVPSIFLAVLVGTLTYLLRAAPNLGAIGPVSGVVIALAVHPTCSLIELGIVESKRADQLACLDAGRSFGFSRPQLFGQFIIPSILTRWLGQFSNVASSVFVSAAVCELVFSIPGIGSVLVRALTEADVAIIQGATILILGVFLILNAAFESVLLAFLGSERN